GITRVPTFGHIGSWALAVQSVFGLYFVQMGRSHRGQEERSSPSSSQLTTQSCDSPRRWTRRRSRGSGTGGTATLVAVSRFALYAPGSVGAGASAPTCH